MDKSSDHKISFAEKVEEEERNTAVYLESARFQMNVVIVASQVMIILHSSPADFLVFCTVVRRAYFRATNVIIRQRFKKKSNHHLKLIFL